VANRADSSQDAEEIDVEVLEEDAEIVLIRPDLEPPFRPAPRRSAPPSRRPPAPRARRISIGASALMVGAGAFGATLALLVFHAMRTPPEVRTVIVHVPAAPTPTQAHEVQLADEIVITGAPDASAEVLTSAPIAKARDRARPPRSEIAPVQSQDDALLARMGQDLDDRPPSIDLTPDRETTPRAPAGRLDEATARATVRRHERGIRLCYERAVRGLRDTPQIRLRATIEISPAGRVTSSRLEGPDPTSRLHPCVEQNLRTWRFPQGSEPTTLPLSFVLDAGN
jgi:hypothetical protein